MKRRSFIYSSAMAGSGLSLVPGLMDACDTPIALSPLNKKSLKWGMIKEDLSVLQKFELIKSLGFDGVELDSPDDLNDDEVLEAKAKTGIEIPGLVNSVHWKQSLSDPDPAVRAACVEATVNGLHRCKKLGGTTVLLVPAVVKADVFYEDAYNRSVEEIKKILPAARETGVKIAIENVWNNFLISPVEAKKYIDDFNDDHIGWYMDIGNIVRYGWPAHWIKALGSRIIKVDIKDYSRKKQTDEGIWEGFKVLLGDGDADWPAVNKALAEVGYSGWGSAEVSGGDRTRLKEISERMDRLYAM